MSRMPNCESNRILRWKAGRKGLRTPFDEEVPARLFDLRRNPVVMDGSTTNALWAYLDAREYIADRVHRKRVVSVTLSDVRQLSVREYSGWRSSRADGSQVYRTPAKGRSDTKDASWVIVSEMYKSRKIL